MQLVLLTLVQFLSVFQLLHSYAATNITLSEIQISVSENFKTQCQNDVKTYLDNAKEKWDKSKLQEPKSNISSAECLLYCGYMKMGMVDKHGNIEMTYLKSFTLLQKSDYFRQTVSKCMTIKKTTNVCAKASENTMCVTARLGPKMKIFVDLRLMTMLMD